MSTSPVTVDRVRPAPWRPAAQYLADIWACRYFWWSLACKDLASRYRRSALGLAWSLLQPIAMTIVVCIAFGGVFKLDLATLAPRLLAGLTVWQFISGCVLRGSACVFGSEAYIRQYPAPIAIYPLRVVLASAVHLLIGLSAALPVLWVFQGFEHLPGLPWAAPALVLLFLFGWALAVISGLATVFMPDVQHLAEVGMQLAFYATPILYPAAAFGNGAAGWLFRLNPFTSMVEVLLQPLLTGQAPGWATFGPAVAVTLAAACCGSWMLARLERKVVYAL